MTICDILWQRICYVFAPFHSFLCHQQINELRDELNKYEINGEISKVAYDTEVNAKKAAIATSKNVSHRLCLVQQCRRA